ncbi:hypothetical protein BDV93DRAFT_326654 [Ceratobasidium sp. AG-I]|nr:hypothetical protein BDV93DRAFT_326654 [Ceratobasidium sp. AG-I]
MALSPGTYVIYCNSANVVVDDVQIRDTVEVHIPHKRTNQQWRVQQSAHGGYAIKNVSSGLFLGTGTVWGGSRLERACKHDAHVWNIQHQHDNVHS